MTKRTANRIRRAIAHDQLGERHDYSGHGCLPCYFWGAVLYPVKVPT